MSVLVTLVKEQSLAGLWCLQAKLSFGLFAKINTITIYSFSLSDSGNAPHLHTTGVWPLLGVSVDHFWRYESTLLALLYVSLAIHLVKPLTTVFVTRK